MQALHSFFFAGLPYIAIIGFVGGLVFRIKAAKARVTKTETEELFWGYFPFHIGLSVVFVGHLVGFMFPKSLLAFNSHPIRLIIFEITGIVFGLCLLIGFLHFMIRGFIPGKVKTPKSMIDVAVETLLLYQIILGCWTAIAYRWGSSWFAASLSPYLWSILKLSPQTEAVKAMPHIVQFHIITAFLIILLLPFSRLFYFLGDPHSRFARSRK